jgi:rubrerythrin
MEFDKSKTKENLRVAFERETGASAKYAFFAEQARADGYEQIFNIFNDFAKNEQAHAKIWYKRFHAIGGTEQNLIDSAEIENFEHSVFYTEFAKIAEEEGFSDIATLFEGVANVEKNHEKTFRALYEKVKNDTFFSGKSETVYKCTNCGHQLKGKSAPEKCPVCSHPQAFFNNGSVE